MAEDDEELSLSVIDIAEIEMEGAMDGNRGVVHGLGIEQYEDVGGEILPQTSG